MHWFQSLIIAELKARGWPDRRGALADFSRAVGIDNHSKIIKWANGTEPGITHVEQVISRLGGDMSRALPDAPPASTDEELKGRLRRAEEDARQLRGALSSLGSHLIQIGRTLQPSGGPSPLLLREVIRDGSAPEAPLPTVLVDAPEPPPPPPKPKKKK